jgi:hypothetical protein
LSNNLAETIADNLNYVDGIDDILGKFYYLSDPDKLRQAIELWLVQTPEGLAWLESLGFVNKEAVVKVIDQIENNLQESSRDLLTKIHNLKSYVNAKGSAENLASVGSELR